MRKEGAAMRIRNAIQLHPPEALKYATDLMERVTADPEHT